MEIDPEWVSPFQLSVSFHIKPFIKTGHLFCRAKQMTGFFMTRNIGLKWIKERRGAISLLYCQLYYARGVL